MEDEVAGGGVIVAESDVEVEVPEEEAVSVMETGPKTLVVADDELGSTSETTLFTPPPTPDRMLGRPPSTPPRRPPLLDEEGAGVMEESEALEVDELVSLEVNELVSLAVDEEDESVGDEALLLLLPPSENKVRKRSFYTLVLTHYRGPNHLKHR